MIKDKKMFKKMLVKKVAVGLILFGTGLFSAVSQGAIIASYDAEVSVEVSSTFESNEFETVLCCNNVYTEGSASGNASGSGDAGPFFSGPGVLGTLSAAANGEVTGDNSYVDSSWATDGYLFIENTTNSAITGDVKFDISLFASIFTDNIYAEAFAGAYIYIENRDFDVIFDDFIEFDSFFDGLGTFDLAQTFTVDVKDLTIAAGDFEEYLIVIDAIGVAAVPEPGGVFLAGLALLLAVRKRRTSLK